jgi:hypothetical protein
MGLGSTQPLTEMSTRNFAVDKERPGHKADNFTAICEPSVWKTWEPRRLKILWAFIACYRENFLFNISGEKVFMQCNLLTSNFNFCSSARVAD